MPHTIKKVCRQILACLNTACTIIASPKTGYIINDYFVICNLAVNWFFCKAAGNNSVPNPLCLWPKHILDILLQRSWETFNCTWLSKKCNSKLNLSYFQVESLLKTYRKCDNWSAFNSNGSYQVNAKSVQNPVCVRSKHILDILLQRLWENCKCNLKLDLSYFLSRVIIKKRIENAIMDLHLFQAVDFN